MGWRMSSKVDTAAKVGRLRDDLQNSVKKLAKNWMVVIKIVNIKIFQEYIELEETLISKLSKIEYKSSSACS